MFYSQCLVSRKGPLGSIWVAAYFFKKLKKAQVKDTHIPSSADLILQKELDALTYRVLAYILLGVVRIYSKKVDFLFDDCNKALVGVKEFVAKEKNRETTIVQLPASTGFFSIALPDRFELDAFDLGSLDDFHGNKPVDLDSSLTSKIYTDELEDVHIKALNLAFYALVKYELSLFAWRFLVNVMTFAFSGEQYVMLVHMLIST